MPPSLSRRLTEVVQLASEGKTDKEIALALGIGTGTVATHWKRLRAHFHASSRAEIVAKSFAETAERAEGLHSERERLLFSLIEQKRLEAELREANEALELEVRKRERLLAEMMAEYEAKQSKLLRRLDELERLHAVVSGFGIVANEGLHGASWRKTWVSEAMNQFGYTPAEILAGDVTIFNTLSPDDLTNSLEEFRADEIVPGLRLCTHRFLTRDGRVRHLLDFIRLEEIDESVGSGPAKMVAFDVTDWLPLIREKIARGWPDLPLGPRTSPI